MNKFQNGDIVRHATQSETPSIWSFGSPDMIIIGTGQMATESGIDVIYLVSYLSREGNTMRAFIYEVELRKPDQTSQDAIDN